MLAGSPWSCHNGLRSRAGEVLLLLEVNQALTHKKTKAVAHKPTTDINCFSRNFLCCFFYSSLTDFFIYLVLWYLCLFTIWDIIYTFMSSFWSSFLDLFVQDGFKIFTLTWSLRLNKWLAAGCYGFFYQLCHVSGEPFHLLIHPVFCKPYQAADAGLGTSDTAVFADCDTHCFLIRTWVHLRGLWWGLPQSSQPKAREWSSLNVHLVPSFVSSICSCCNRSNQ